MPSVLHLADLHLGWTPRGLPAEVAASVRRRRDALLGQAVDLALGERVDLVVIAGDLFESYRPEPALVDEALAQLRRLTAAGIALVTVPGNHDELTYARSVYRRASSAWPGVLVTRPDPGPVADLRLAGERVRVTSLAYVGGVTPALEPLRAFPRGGDGIALAAFHGTLVGPHVRPGDPFGGGRSLPLDQRALGEAGFAYVALGHLHVPQEIALAGGGLAVYPGCVGGKGPSDPGAAHWTLVEVHRGGARVRRVAADVAPVWTREVDVGGFDDADALAAHLRGLGTATTWGRVRLVGALAFEVDPARLAERAGDAFLHLEVDDATTSIAPELLARWAAQPTVRGEFVRRLRARIEAATDERERAVATRALRHGLHALAGDA
ncbi:MAG: metallophosphoesterase family protein [Trueperaceae bacterium]